PVRAFLLRPQREAVPGEVAALELGDLGDAVLILPLCVEEVPDRLGPAADLEAVLVTIADAVRRGLLVLVQVVDGHAVLRTGPRRHLVEEALHGVVRSR